MAVHLQPNITHTAPHPGYIHLVQSVPFPQMPGWGSSTGGLRGEWSGGRANSVASCLEPLPWSQCIYI